MTDVNELPCCRLCGNVPHQSELNRGTVWCVGSGCLINGRSIPLDAWRLLMSPAPDVAKLQARVKELEELNTNNVVNYGKIATSYHAAVNACIDLRKQLADLSKPGGDFSEPMIEHTFTGCPELDGNNDQPLSAPVARKDLLTETPDAGWEYKLTLRCDGPIPYGDFCKVTVTLPPSDKEQKLSTDSVFRCFTK